MEYRTCKVCGEAKEAVRGTWVTLCSKPIGKVCQVCNNKISLARHHADPNGKLKVREASRKSRATPEGRAKHNATNLAWKKEHPDKTHVANTAWKKENPDKNNAHSAKRRAARHKQTPAWLTRDDYKRMEDTYAIAKYFSELAMIPYHVDHIIPLRGKLVSGLHVPSNLCIRLGADNLSKGNKWAP